MLIWPRKNLSLRRLIYGIIMWFKQRHTCPMLATACTSWCARTREPCSVQSWCMTCKADLDHLELHSPNLVTRPSAVRLVFAADLQQITITEKVSKHKCLPISVSFIFTGISKKSTIHKLVTSTKKALVHVY